MNTHRISTRGAGTTSLLVGIAIAVLAAFVLFVVFSSSSSEPINSDGMTSAEVTPMEGTSEEEMMDGTEAREAEMDDGAMMDDMSEVEEMNDAMDSMEANEQQSNAGVFTDYDEALLANANSGDVVLFFHASWCPSCRTLENNINENSAAIPSDVTILKLDYDTELELRQKYGVTRQHTLVKVNADGTEIEKLTGLTNSLDQVVSQL